MSYLNRQSTTSRRKLQGGLLALALVFYLIVVILHYQSLVDWIARNEQSVSLLGMITGILAFTGAVGVSILMDDGKVRLKFSSTVILLTCFFFVCAFLSVLSIDPTKSFASALVGILITFNFTYSAPLILYNSRFLFYTALVYVCYLFYLVFLLEIRFGLTVGGIQPNQFAKAAIVAMILGYLSNHRYKQYFGWFALACSLLTTSRGGLLFLTCFFVVYYGLVMKWLTQITWIITAVVLVCLLWTAEVLFGIQTVTPVYSKILLLDDAIFGFGTGFTGRDFHWEVGLTLFAENPLIGYGFNTRQSLFPTNFSASDSHQGYINLLLDVGILGTTIYFSAIALFAKTQFLRIRSTENHNVKNLSRTMLAFLCAYHLLMLFDPYNINFAFPLSILMLFCLCSNSTDAPTWQQSFLDDNGTDTDPVDEPS